MRHDAVRGARKGRRTSAEGARKERDTIKEGEAIPSLLLVLLLLRLLRLRRTVLEDAPISPPDAPRRRKTARKRRRRARAHRRRFFERARAPVRGTQGEGATRGATSEGREAGGWLCSPSLSAGRRKGRNDRTRGALARSRAEPRWRSHDGWCAVITRCAVMDDPATIRGAFARSRDRAFARLSRSRRRSGWFDGRCARGERTIERSNDRNERNETNGCVCHPRGQGIRAAHNTSRALRTAPRRDAWECTPGEGAASGLGEVDRSIGRSIVRGESLDEFRSGIFKYSYMRWSWSAVPAARPLTDVSRLPRPWAWNAPLPIAEAPLSPASACQTRRLVILPDADTTTPPTHNLMTRATNGDASLWRFGHK